LPAAVTNALNARYPGAVWNEIREVDIVKGKETTVDHYEVVLLTVAKKQLEIELAPDGRIREEQSAEGDRQREP
jgi:hypothetical protein